MTVSATGMSSRYSVARLERLEHVLDRLDVADDVLGGDEGERVRDLVRELLVRPRVVRVDARVVPVAEHEVRERRCVAADRRLRLRGADLERPARLVRGAVPVAREHAGLERPDRPPPAAGRRVLPALAIALRGAREPLAAVLAGHQRAEPRGTGGVAHPRQLPLARVRLVGQAPRAVLVALARAAQKLVPIGHAAQYPDPLRVRPPEESVMLREAQFVTEKFVRARETSEGAARKACCAHVRSDTEPDTHVGRTGELDLRRAPSAGMGRGALPPSRRRRRARCWLPGRRAPSRSKRRSRRSPPAAGRPRPAGACASGSCSGSSVCSRRSCRRRPRGRSSASTRWTRSPGCSPS